MESLHWLDYIIVIAYFAIIIFVGMSFKRFIKQAKDYFTAGAGVPWWLAGVSLWMASFSATTFVIYSQIAYKYGFVAMSIAWSVIPSMVIAAGFLAVRWRRARVMTPLGFMEQRYSKAIHQVFVWTGIPLRVVDNSLRVLATAIFMTVAIGQPWFTLELCIVVVGIIMILYSIVGGQWAVLITDFFQSLILVLSVLILLPLSLNAVGGISGLVQGIEQVGGPDTFFQFLTPQYDFFYWIMFVLMISVSYNATWGLVQKYNCVATEADARKVAITMGILSFIGPLIFFVPAMVARVLIPELMGPPDQSADVYVAVALKVLPVGIMGLLVAGMFSATLSTLGNDYNVLSGVLTSDFYGKVINPNADEKKMVFMGRVNMTIIGVITILSAIGLNYLKEMFNLIDIMIKAFGALGPAIMLPLLGGLLVKKINAKGALFGVIFGTISGVTLVVVNAVLLAKYSTEIADNETLSYWLKQWYNSASIGVNIIVTMIAMWIGSIITKTPEEEKQRVDEFFSHMSKPTEPKLDKAGEAESPFTLVGLALTLMGIVLAVVAVLVTIFIGGATTIALNFGAAAILIITGVIMWVRSRSKLPITE